MDVPFELHIALRYLLAKRKQAFISVISLISTLGVAVGVMAVIIALAVMTGLQQELRDRILGSNPHIFVSKTGGIADYHAEAARLRQIPHVVGAAPAILGRALVTATRNQEFITLKGIDPALEPTVSDIGRSLQSGSIDDLVPKAGSDAFDGILLGKDLAGNLGAAVGDSVIVLTPEGTLSPMGMIPGRRRMRVAGIFSLGLFEFDSTYGFVALDAAMRMLDKDHVDFLQLRVDDIYRAPEIAAQVTATMGDQYLTQDWAEINRSLFSALWLEKIAVSLAIGLIVMVAALNIVATLILLVMEKHKDIAILVSMGASRGAITRIFMLQGTVIGALGTLAGAVLGWGACRVLDAYRLIRVPVDVYQISYVPFKLLPLDAATVIVGAVLICFLATIHPARGAARLDPAEALRYE
jgi:lipoprotein-releasing system permease protein